MKAAGIICEYNPFHNGHAYQIAQTRAQGATHIVAVMSGAFVQRGDIAITNKWARAKAALDGGADLVLELPCAYALSSAEYFARGAVHILSALGCVDLLSFGSESGDITALMQAASAANAAKRDERLLARMKAGQPFPAALARTVAERGDSAAAEIVATPNNTLGVEYLTALSASGSNIKPIAISRKGAGHDSAEAQGEFASATHIRSLLAEGVDTSMLTPMQIRWDDMASLARLETAILFRLRGLSRRALACVPDVEQGLGNRIYDAVRSATSLEALYYGIKTKRYTMARIRRIVLCAALGITKKDLQILPPYARIIGINTRGFELVAKSKKSHRIPVGHSLARLAQTSPQARRFADLESYAGDVFALALPERLPCGTEFTTNAVVQKQ